MKFRADANGFITGIRFYKSAAEYRHARRQALDSSSGTLLGSATFTNETASGWQQVIFGTPVAVTANTTYVASYHTPTGHYSASSGYFANAGVDAPPLHALSNVDGAERRLCLRLGRVPDLELQRHELLGRRHLHHVRRRRRHDAADGHRA